MFGKKCPRCNKKSGKDYEFCPYCGFNFNSPTSRKLKEREDFGLLGESDFEENFQSPRINSFGMNMPMGFEKLFNSLFNELDKQMKEMDREIGREKQSNKIRTNGISISFSSGTGMPPQIRIKDLASGREIQPEIRQIKNTPNKIKETNTNQLVQFSESDMKKISKLPRKEADTKLKRISDKIIYEIAMPGVDSISNVMVNKLENSIEIKAIGKDTVYFKLIPVNLPISKYNLKDEKLILELKEKN